MAQQYSNVQMAAPAVTEQPSEVNWKYANTKIGFFKILSVALGLLTLYLSAYAYDNATAAISVLYEACDYNNDGSPSNCALGFYTMDYICEESNTRIRISSEKIINEEEKKKELEQLQTCPSRWLVVPQIYIIGIIWACTLIMLIVMLVSNPKAAIFRTLDLIGHLIAALLVIVSGLCFFGYVISVLVRNECKIPDEAKKVFPRSETVNGTAEPRQYGNQLGPLRNCEEATRYKHWHILSAGFFAIFTGFVYILIALSSKGGPVFPMRALQQQQQYFSASQQAQMQGTASQQQANQPPNMQPGYPQPSSGKENV